MIFHLFKWGLSGIKGGLSGIKWGLSGIKWGLTGVLNGDLREGWWCLVDLIFLVDSD